MQVVRKRVEAIELFPEGNAGPTYYLFVTNLASGVALRFVHYDVTHSDVRLPPRQCFRSPSRQ